MSNTNQSLCTCGCCEDGGTVTPLDLYNTSGLSALQYRAGTHNSFKESMLRELAKKQSLAPLTARYDDDLTIATIDAWATVLDVLTFYQERIINEGYLRTSTERVSVLELARHISYKLAPGVAAGTCLAFTLNDAPGNPVKTDIPKGTKVQSIPGQNELPQLFETIEDFEARLAWNSMPVQTTVKRFPKKNDKTIYLEGISTGLQPGDAILIIGDEVDKNPKMENWDFRRIKEVIPNNGLNYTKITWDKGLGKFIHGTQVEPAHENVKAYAMKQKAFLFGYNAPDWRTVSDSVKSQFLPGGLSGEYFNDTFFGAKVLARTDNTINFDWGSGSPSGAVNTDNFSVRWTGYILAPVSDSIKFHTQSDDGVRLWVNDKLIIDKWTEHRAEDDYGTILLQQGQLYSIKLEYFEKGGSAVIKLLWSASNLQEEVIPARYFFQPGTYAEWPDFTLSKIAAVADTVCLDNLYPKILKDSWMVLSADSYEEIFRVENAAESSRKNFTLTSKTSLLELEGEHLTEIYDTHVRDTVAYAQSEEFQIADTPVEEPIVNYQEVTLQNLTAGLDAGKKIIISGKRKRLLIPDVPKKNNLEPTIRFHFIVDGDATATRDLHAGESLIISKKSETKGNKTKWTLIDRNGIEGVMQTAHAIKPVASEKDDAAVSELHTIDSIRPGAAPTVIILKELLENLFDPAATFVYANVVDATHGETKTEVLGSGDGSKKFQKFVLKQKPLTFVSAATASGTVTTLEVRVNDIFWKELSTFYGTSRNDKIYTVSIADDGKVTVMFGDGITGSRLPTGVENIKATYRVGIGLEGSVGAGQLSMLLTPQLGLSKVNNPLAASGADDPESFDTAKVNAPLTVLTLDRTVSAKDYEDFTRAFAGIAKASAEILWSGEQEVVHITFATADRKPVDSKSSLYTNLMAAIKSSSHAYQLVYADNYEALSFAISAGIKTDSNYLFDEVKANVEQALKDNFSFSARDFGQDVTPAEVIAVIQGVEGVVFTDLNSLNGTDPFSTTGFRIIAEKARWQNSITGKQEKILPAQLLTVDESKITIIQII